MMDIVNWVQETCKAGYKSAEKTVKDATDMELHEAATAGAIIGASAIFAPAVLMAAGAVAIVGAAGEGSKQAKEKKSDSKEADEAPATA